MNHYAISILDKLICDLTKENLMFYNIVNGVKLGHESITLDRIESSVRQGHNHYLTCGTQMVQLNTSISFVNTALTAANQSPFSWVIHGATLLSPIALSYALSTKIQNYPVRSIVLFIHDNIGNLSKLVSIISLISIIYFGNVLTPSIALAVYGIGYLDQTGILPVCIRRALHTGAPFITVTTEIVCGSLISRLSSAVSLTLIVAAKYFQYRFPNVLETVHKDLRNEPFTNKTLPEFLQTGSPKTSINRGHLNYPSLPAIPKADITDLYTLCEDIHWDKHLTCLQQKLAKDVRWEERSQRAGTEIQYLKKELRSCVDSIINHRILQGEPGDYEMMITYLKIITDKLPHQSEITIADILMTLAIEGGEYCGPGKFRVIAEVYSSLMTSSIDLPIETKILHSLQQFRKSIFQGIYTEIWTQQASLGMAGQILDFQDVHVFNQFVIYAGASFGLPLQGAADDNTVNSTPIKTAYAKSLMSSFMIPLFWKGGAIILTPFEGYTKASILKHLREQFGTELLPKPDFYGWWMDWIDKQNITEENKEQLATELSESPPKLFGKPFEVDGVLQDLFIEAMLVDIGIFKNTPELTETPIQSLYSSAILHIQ